MFKKYFEYKPIFFSKCQSSQLNETKLHRCALDWCHNCAFCDMGYDELKSMESNSVEYSQFLLKKINQSISKLEELEYAFEEKMNNNLEYIRDIIDVRVDSLRDEVSFMDLNTIKKELKCKIREDLSRAKNDNLNDPNRISIKMIEQNIKKIQDYFDFKIQFLNRISSDDEVDVCLSQIVSDKWHYINKDFSYWIKPAILNIPARFNDIVSLGGSRVAIALTETVEIWDFKACTLVQKLNFGANKLFKMPGVKLFLISRFNKLIILNLETFESEENEIEVNFSLIDAIDEKTFATIIKIIKNYNTKWYLRIFELDGLKMIKKFEKEINMNPDYFFKAGNNRLISTNSHGAYCWDFEGNFIEEIKGFDVRNEYLAEMISENILIGCGYYCGDFVKIWNCETGECLKEFKKSTYLGSTPFGFLILDENINAYRFDKNFTYLGKILTNGVFNTINRIKYLTDNIYICFPKYGGPKFVKIEWEFKDRKEILCCLPMSERCAHCEITFKGNELSRDEMKEILKKTYEIFEECKQMAFKKIDEEENRFKQETLDRKFDKLIKIASYSCSELENHMQNDLVKYFKINIPENIDNLAKLEFLLGSIQKYYGLKFQILFNDESFDLKQDKLIKFVLTQSLSNLKEQYFNLQRYRKVDEIEFNSQLKRFKLLGENSIIYSADNKFEIQSLADKKIKRLLNAKHSIMFDVLSDLFIVSVEDRNDRLVFYDINTSKTSHVSIKGVSCLLALKSGKLLIATHDNTYISIGVWDENKSAEDSELSFTNIKTITDAHKHEIKMMIELPDNKISTLSHEVINIWNSDMSEILYKFNDDYAERLYFIFNDILLINTSEEYLFWNFKTNVVLNRLENDRYNFNFCFLTGDKKFLIFLSKNEMHFYDTNGFYYYASYPILDSLKCCRWDSTIILNGVFHSISDKKLHIFEFK